MQSTATYRIRLAGGLVLAVLAVVVWFAMAPSSDTSPDDFNTQISQALADDKVNNGSAEGAPQQAVVNGWTARDLLTVIAQEGANRSSSADHRPAGMLALVVLGLALMLVTSDRQERLRPATLAQATPQGPSAGPPPPPNAQTRGGPTTPSDPRA